METHVFEICAAFPLEAGIFLQSGGVSTGLQSPAGCIHRKKVRTLQGCTLHQTPITYRQQSHCDALSEVV